jgi:hypothetical protein
VFVVPKVMKIFSISQNVTMQHGLEMKNGVAKVYTKVHEALNYSETK